MIIDNIDFNTLIIQDFDRINENTWACLCYLIVLESSKCFGMKHVSYDFRNAFDSSDSGSKNRRNFDRKVLQSLDSFVDDIPWNTESYYKHYSFVLIIFFNLQKDD